MTTVPQYVAGRVRRPVPAGCQVVPGSTPVVSFGDPRTARVATLGLNPSDEEFTRDGDLLVGGDARLESLDSLGVQSLEEAGDDAVRRVVEGCYGYFNRRPLWSYFSHMERLLQAAGASYRDGTGCQLDLVQWATAPTWSAIPDVRVRERLLREDAEFLRRQLADNPLRLVLLNGRTVVDQVQRVGGHLKRIAQLPSGRHPAWLVRGDLEGVTLLGWTPYIPNGFVSRDRQDAIRTAIGDVAQELGLDRSGSGDEDRGAAPGRESASPPREGVVVSESTAPCSAAPDDHKVSTMLLFDSDVQPAGALVVDEDGFVLLSHSFAVAPEVRKRMSARWPPDGSPGGAPELAVLRRALAAAGDLEEAPLQHGGRALEDAVEVALGLLGELTTHASYTAYHWPSDATRPERARPGSRALLLRELTSNDGARLWAAATTVTSRLVDGWLVRVADGWRPDVLELARAHQSGAIRDLALLLTGSMSDVALELPTEMLGPAEKLYLAGQPSTQRRRLEELMTAGPDVRLRILRRPDLPEDLLVRLTKDAEAELLRLMLDDHRLTPNALLDLLTTLPPEQAEIVASHTRLPLDAIPVADLPRPVREALVRRPSASTALLDALAKDADTDIRIAAAGRCSAGAAERLLSDPALSVRRTAAVNLALPAGAASAAATAGDVYLRLAVAGRPDLTDEQAQALLRQVILDPDTEPGELSEAFRHPAVGVDAIRSALEHSLADVVAAALRNPACPAEDVVVRVVDPDPDIRSAALTAVLDRGLHVSRNKLRLAAEAPLTPRPLPAGWKAYEVPIDLPRMLVERLLDEDQRSADEDDEAIDGVEPRRSRTPTKDAASR